MSNQHKKPYHIKQPAPYEWENFGPWLLTIGFIGRYSIIKSAKAMRESVARRAGQRSRRHGGLPGTPASIIIISG